MGWLRKGIEVTDDGLMKDGGTLCHDEPVVIHELDLIRQRQENTMWAAVADPLYNDLLNDVPPCDDGYDRLRAVFDAALRQSRDGKGKERHADAGTPFEEQVMVTINKKHRGFCLGQAAKKIDESERLPPPHKIQELLGAIVYIAGEIITIQDEES